MKQNTKRALALLTALSLLLSLLAGCSSKVEAATMRLKRTEGTVGVSNGAGKDLEPAENLGLYSGYGVDTKAASFAWIDLDEVKLTKMDENSQVEIKKEDKHLTIEVKSGSLFFNITEPLAEDEMLDIRTSTMLVGIRGTCGWVEVLDEEHMNIYLLEGTVECTAGENTATVNAGEMAEMSADGMIEVSAFSGSAVPAFVREEVEDDKNLMEVISDASGTNATDYSMDSYEELLSTMENVVYSEIIDFEQDGSPELLVITMNFERNSASDVGADGIFIYQNGLDGPVLLGGVGGNMHKRGTYSLVEFNGRLFVRQNMGFGPNSDDSYGCYDTYLGFVVQSDGSSKWGTVDHLQIHYYSDGRPNYSMIWIDSPREDGFIHISDNDGHNYDDPWNFEAVVGKYTHVRDLVSYEGTNVTVAPDPSEIEDFLQPVITEPEPEEPQPDDGQPVEATPGEDITPAAADTTPADEDAGQADQPSNADILEQYKAILAQGKSYTYRSDADQHANDGTAITYKYALYQESGYSVPTLILENRGLDLIGYLLFRYDPAIGTTSQVGDDMASRFEMPSHSFLNYNEIPWDNWHDITDTSYLESWLS